MATTNFAAMEIEESSEGPGSRWLGPVAVAVIAAFATGLFGFYWGNQDRSDFEEQVLRATPLIEAAAADSLVRFEGVSGEAHAVVVFGPGVREAFLRAEGFPTLKGNDVYQAWFTNDGVNFVASNAFTETGEGRWLWAAEAIEQQSAVAFTVEPERGARRMTSEPFLVIEF